MNEKNAKINKTKKSLQDALYTLMTKKKVEDISVTELCEEATINRTTFYKYYAIPFDVLDEHMSNICNKALKCALDDFSSLKEADISKKMLQICMIYYKNNLAVQSYLKYNMDFLSLMTNFEGLEIVNKIQKESLMNFIIGGISSVILQWAKNDFEQSPEEIANTLAKFVLRNFS